MLLKYITILLLGTLSAASKSNHTISSSWNTMPYITTKDGTEIYYKDWGNPNGQPIVFSHGWPLDSDNFENQMFFLGQLGYRTIAHDRRGHGRSSQPWGGNDMDTYADDLLVLFEHLDIKDAMMVGHSTGGGEVMRFCGRHGTSRVSKAVLIDAVTPHLVQSEDNPAGVPISVFDGFRAQMIKNRAQLFMDIPSGPFFNYNRPNVTVSQGLIQSWYSQGMLCGFKAAYDCIKAFSETDFTEDMKNVDIPVLLLHGTDDQVVPIDASARVAIKLLKKGTLKEYPGAPHGTPNVLIDEVNRDLLSFVINGTVSP